MKEFNKLHPIGSKEIHICKNCNKEYKYEIGQPNWTKSGLGNGKGTIDSRLYCCYECGVAINHSKGKNTRLKLYGSPTYVNVEKQKQTKAKNKKQDYEGYLLSMQKTQTD